MNLDDNIRLIKEKAGMININALNEEPKQHYIDIVEILTLINDLEIPIKVQMQHKNRITYYE